MNVERSVVSPWGGKGVGKKKNRGGTEARVGREATKKNGGQARGGGRGTKRVTTMKLDVCTRPGPKEKNIRVRKE